MALVVLALSVPGNRAETGPAVDTEENAAALEILDEAGVSPTREELARTRGGNENGLPGFGGTWGLRGTIREGDPGGLTGRLALAWGDARVRARLRTIPGRPAARSGGATWRRQGWSFFAGRLGMRLGYGLVTAGPGRTSNLAADSGLGMPAGRLAIWTGDPDGRTRFGAGMGIDRPTWRMRILAARPAGQLSGGPVGAIHLGIGPASSGLGLTLARDPAGNGAGLSATWQAGVLSLWGEGAVRYAGDAHVPWTVHVAARWRRDRWWGLEAAWAFADSPAVAPGATRSSLLPAARGRGYALRAWARTPGDMGLRILVHEGSGEPAAGDGERLRRRLLDVQARRSIGPGLWLSGRVRRSSRQVWTFDVRHPWLSPTPATTRLRTVYSLSIVREEGPWRTTALVRSLGQETPGLAGRRSLLALTTRMRHPDGWILRLHGTTAWGDDVDLVSAVVPLDGLILPRHWGRWRSGVGGGAGRKTPRFGWEVAAGLRNPEPGRGETATPWLRMAVHGGW